MTEQRKRKLRNRIEASRSRLMISQPYFALLLMYLKFVAVSDMKKISTNGRCIYFSPNFIEKLYDYELDYILCHQVMHIIWGHIWRTHDLAGEAFHYTSDVFVNTMLFQCGFDDEKYPHFGNLDIREPMEVSNPVKLSYEELILPYGFSLFDEKTKSRYFPDTDDYWDSNDNGSLGELILNLPKSESIVRGSYEGSGGSDYKEGEDGEPDNNALKQAWRDLASSLAKNLKTTDDSSKGAGGMPEFMKRLVKQTKDADLDWRKILNDFLQERICDYSFSPPDRRFSETDFFLPDFNEKEYVSKDVLFMVDTSGSINDKELSSVYSEIKGAIEQFDGKLSGKLGFFDWDVKEPQPFENVDDLTRIIPYGGGGTDFTVIFEYIKENYSNELPACVVIFTDGDGPYPDEEDTMSLPVLWIVNNNRHIPPFGKVIRILTVDSFK